MSTTTLGAALITKGEAELEKAVGSIRPHVDEVVIVYTGPPDEAREAAARKLADRFEVFRDANDAHGLADFGRARQRSFDLLESEAGMWLDSQDVVRGAEHLREIVGETMPADGPALLKCPYEYAHDEHGRVTTYQWRERVVRPVSAFAWRNRVHEVLVPLDGLRGIGETDSVVFVETRKGPPDYARNIRILKSVLAENPDDLRSQFYLALDLFTVGDWLQAGALFERFASNEDAPVEERVMALLRLSHLLVMKGDCEGAMRAASGALSLRPWDSCCFALARAAHALAERANGDASTRAWEHCAFWARAGLAIPPAKTDLWQNPIDREGLIDLSLHLALGHLGDVRGAAESVERALAVMPDEPALLSSQLVYQAAIGRLEQRDGKRRAEAAAARAEKLRRGGQINRTARDAVFVEGGLPPGRPEGSLDVVFACGDAAEPWNPVVMEDRGIGGSEQAVVNLTRRLAQRGHRVRVFANCGLAPKHYDGVEYIPTRGILQAGDCDVVVGWRSAQAIEAVRSKVRLIWAHDVMVQNVNEWRGVLVDRVMALSEWHRGCLEHAHPEFSPEKFHVTRNGVDLALFDQKAKVRRDRLKAVFSSSPTRGLDVLLDVWPDISDHVLAAAGKRPTLHVFYGMQSTVAQAYASGNTDLLRRVERYEERLAEMAPYGVFARGRVPPRELAREMLSAGAWLYPCWDEVQGEEPWFETSCIGAMEAQVAGLRIVTLGVGALSETVVVGTLIDDDPRDGIGRETFVEQSVQALLSEMDRDAISEVGRSRFGWDPVAEEWESLMNHLLDVMTKEQAA